MPYRILSLDGGGSWALIEVKALIALYSTTGDGSDVTGHRVLRDFDLAVANSGGTIVLGGLIKDMRLSDLLGFFHDQAQRQRVFVRTGFFADPMAHILRLVGVGPKYAAAAKLKGLQAVLGDAGEIMVSGVPALLGRNYAGRETNVVFCAFDYDTKREVFLRSKVDSLSGNGSAAAQASVALAIHASSNAPVNFFDAPAQDLNPDGRQDQRRYWDGAVGGYNNPVLAGVVEALANGVPRGDVVALSIGTGNVALPLEPVGTQKHSVLLAKRGSSTIVNDLTKMASSILDDPPDAASFIAHIMIGGRLPARGGPAVTDGRLIRLNPLVQPQPGASPGVWVLPDGLSGEEFDALANKIGMDAVKDDEVALIDKLCDAWLKDEVRNQAIRTNSETLAPEIGFAKFSEAKEAWLAACRSG